MREELQLVVTSLFGVLTVFHLAGSDGVLDINSTTGCITFTTYPSLLRKELYEIKVKVKIYRFYRNKSFYMLYLSPLIVTVYCIIDYQLFKPRQLK